MRLVIFFLFITNSLSIVFSKGNTNESSNTHTILNICENFNQGIYDNEQIKVFENFYFSLPQNNLSDVAGLTKSAVYLSLAYYNTHQYKQAEKTLEHCLVFIDKMNAYDDPYYATIVQSLASYYSFRGDYETAIKFIQDRIPNLSDWNKSIMEQQLANSYFKFGQLDSALVHQSKGLNIMENIYTKYSTKEIAEFLAAAYGAKAAMYEEKNCDDKIKCCNKALDIMESQGINESENYKYIYNNLCVAYYKKGDFKNSLLYINKCQSLDPLDLDIAQNKLYVEYLLNKNDSTTYNSYLSLIKEREKELEYLTEHEQFILWSNLKSYYNNLLYIYINNEQKNGEIYNILLHIKGHLLQSAIDFRKRIYQSQNQDLISIYEGFSKNGIEITENQIKKFYPKVLLNIPTPSTWNLIKNKLKKEDVAIEFFVVPFYQKNHIKDWQYCAAIIKKEYKSPQIVKLCLRNEILKIDSIQETYSSKRIFELLWNPLIKEMEQSGNVYFSPDYDLNNIAIENAINNDGNRMSSLYNLYRLSSTKELLYNTKTNKLKTATLFGGIQYNDIDNKKINDLPGSKFEIEEISKLLNAEGYKIDIYTNNYASEYKFKNVKSQNSILHLSTHGFYNTPNTKHYNLNINFPNESTPAMAFSGLLFSGVSSYLSDKKLIDGEDGILTALEVSQLYFNNLDLVVLSACESGVGALLDDGVYGLPRGFKLAGAKSILMSLWEVDDDATKMLMVEFYKNFLKGETKSMSLKKAQEYVKSQPGFEDPYYWAGFILLDGLD